jgi:hypothetical protein
MELKHRTTHQASLYKEHTITPNTNTRKLCADPSCPQECLAIIVLVEISDSAEISNKNFLHPCDHK